MKRSDRKSAPDHWRGPVGAPLVALLTSLVALGPFSVSFYVPAMPTIAAALEADPGGVQSTMTTFLLGFGLSQLLIGPLSDKYGRRPILLLALAFFIAASVLCAFVTTLPGLQAMRFIQGVGACCGPVLGRAMVRDLFDGPDMARVFAIIGTAVALGPALGPIAGGAAHQFFGWRMIFIVIAAVALALWILAAAKLGESNAHRSPDAMRPGRLLRIYGELLTNGPFMGHVLVGALVFSGVFAYHATASFLFIAELGVSPAAFGAIAIATVPAYALGNFLSGRLIKFFEGRRLIGIGLVIAIFGAVMTELVSDALSLPRVVVPMMLYFFGFGMILPHAISGALQPFPRVAGSASAVMGAMQMGCGAAASAVAALIYDASARPFGWLVIALALSAALAYFILTPVSADPDRRR